VKNRELFLNYSRTWNSYFSRLVPVHPQMRRLLARTAICKMHVGLTGSLLWVFFLLRGRSLQFHSGSTWY